MQLRKQGLEQFYPHWSDIVTTSSHNLTFKLAKHFDGGQIMAGKMREYEFMRPRKNIGK
jgi:hypothetical protein